MRLDLDDLQKAILAAHAGLDYGSPHLTRIALDRLQRLVEDVRVERARRQAEEEEP